jgi:type III secretory pathway component EscS
MQEVLLYGLRVLFLLSLPLLLAAAVMGTLVAALQTTSSISENSIGYAAKLLVLAAVVYLLFPSAVSMLSTLMRMALGAA